MKLQRWIKGAGRGGAAISTIVWAMMLPGGFSAAHASGEVECQSPGYRSPILDVQIGWLLKRTPYEGRCFDDLVSGHGDFEDLWYRSLRQDSWTWQGVSHDTIDLALARILARDARTDRQVDASDNRADTFGEIATSSDRAGAWQHEWLRSANSAERRARRAPAALKKSSYLRTSALYNIASYPHLLGDEVARNAYERAHAAYRKAGEHFAVPLEVLEIPVEDGSGSVLTYLHMPESADGPVPVAIVTGGVDVTMLENQPIAELLNARGIAMAGFDAPGIGMSERWPLDADQTWVHRQVIRYLVSHANELGIDASRIVALATSMGGNPVTRLAFDSGPDEPIVAVANVCGATGSVFASSLPVIAFGFPLMTLEATAASLGLPHTTFEVGNPASFAPFRERLLPVSLYEQGYLTKWFAEDANGFTGPLDEFPEQPIITSVSILSLNTTSDPIGSVPDMQRIEASTTNGETRLYPEYEGHCAPRPHSIPYAAWWLSEQVGTATP